MLDPNTEHQNNFGFNHKFGPNVRKTASNSYESSSGCWNGEFKTKAMDEENGVCSPPLWGTTTSSASSTPPRGQFQWNSNRHLTPITPRAEAIARGQRELMQMVKNMPETTYELTLKDLVEHHQGVVEDEDDSTLEERKILGNEETLSKRWKVNKNKGTSKRKESSFVINQNRGFLLNVFPFSFGLSKRKTVASSSWAKVSPKPHELVFDKSSSDGADRREWWKRRLSFSSESCGGLTSSSSGSTGRSGSSGSSLGGSRAIRRNTECTTGCWNFFDSKKTKSDV